MRPVRRRTLLLAAATASAAACAPTPEGGFDLRPAEPDDPYTYVALGDSISIDEYAGGPGRGGASLLARNLDDDFPQWRGRDLSALDRRLRYHLLAVDGGTTRTLLEAQLPRLESSGLRPDVVTLTVGGNDLLGAYGDTERARQIVRSVRVRVGEALDRLTRLMRAPDHQLVVGTVYDPSDGSGEAHRVGLPPWPDVVGLLAELNAGLRAAAQQNGARVAEIHGRFLGHGLRAGNPAQSDPRPDDRDLWYCRIIEPNAWGADAVRASFWDALQSR